MSEPTTVEAVAGSPANSSGRRTRPALRNVTILCVALLFLAGGWWVTRTGLVDLGVLGQSLAPAAQTASSVAAGVQAQGDTAAGEVAAAVAVQVDAVQASATTTPAVAGGRPAGAPPAGARPQGTPPAGFPPNDQTPGQALVDSVEAVSEEASATASSEMAATPSPEATTVTTVANLVTIPAVAGVKGSHLYDESGALLRAIESGESVLIGGRSPDTAWLAVTTGGAEGWVQAKELIAYGLLRLPVLELPAAVAAVSTTTAAGDSAASSDLVSLGITTAVTSTAPVTILALPEETVGTSATVTATVMTDDGRLNLRQGPGTAYAIIGKGENGTVYTVLGRNEEGDWLQLQMEGEQAGWASAAYLEVAGAVEDLPVQRELASAVQAATTPAAANDTAANADSAVTLISASIASSSTTTASPVAVATASAADDGLVGTLVFQQSPGGMIYAYDLAAGDLWTLTSGFDPAISPDGGTVAFVRSGGETGLYLINIDGSNERRIFERAALSSPKWSTDGQWIVFTRNDEGVECYKVSDRQCLLPDEFNKRFPMGAPSEIPLVTEYQYKLSAVDLNGDNYHDISSLNSARAADWSDAGIVYQSSAGLQITADVEGTTTQEIIFDNLNPYYYDPDLQPGGGQIVFQIKGAAQTDLWVANTDGSGLHSLTQPKTTLVDSLPSNVAAAYSPDGQSIVFLSNRTESGEAGEWRLWVMNADGTNQRQLPVDVTIEYTYGDDQVVSWGA